MARFKGTSLSSLASQSTYTPAVRIGGEFTSRLRLPGLRLGALVVAAAVIISVSACGNAAEGPSPSDAPSNLVSRSEVDRAKGGSVEQALLEYWSALQYQAWAEVASYYDKSLRGLIGTASIIGAKKLNAPSYPLLKPSIVEVTSRDDLSTIKYSLRLADGTRELSSVTWREVDGSWQIVYDSRLDTELTQFEENQVEISRTGVLPTEISEISPDAVRAGGKGAQKQARFLQELYLKPS